MNLFLSINLNISEQKQIIYFFVFYLENDLERWLDLI